MAPAFHGVDLATHVLAYLPFRFFCAAVLRHPLTPLLARLAAVLFGGCLCVGMELLPNYLPSRVPSNLDLACNTAGALVGGVFGTRLGCAG